MNWLAAIACCILLLSVLYDLLLSGERLQAIAKLLLVAVILLSAMTNLLGKMLEIMQKNAEAIRIVQ